MKIGLISTSTFPADQGLRTLSACLKREGHKVKMFFLPMEEDYTKVYSKNVLEQLKRETKDFGLIGITAMASTRRRAKQLIDMYKSLGIPVVWGGAHPTFYPEDCFKVCDMIAVGEAEEALIELADKIEKGKDITKTANIWLRKDGKEYKNDVRAPAKDLDWLAHPDYEVQDHKILENGRLIPFEERHVGGMIFFQTERGCPQACTFCTNNILRKLYKGKSDLLRTHSVDYVIKEFVRLKEMFSSISVFDVRDETFLIRDIKWLKEFAQRYKKEVGIRFKCLSEPASMGIDQLSDEKIGLLVDAGLTDIIIGIQSGSDRVNFEVYKRWITGKQVLKAAKILNKYHKKLTVMYDIIASNPYENKEDILETINLIKQLPSPYYLSINNLVLFEGTPLYNQALQDGYVKPGDDSTSFLNYWDRWKHIKAKKKNAYLNLVLNLMRGPVTKDRFGVLPRKAVDFLIKGNLVDYNVKHKWLTALMGRGVQSMDLFREELVKPLYRSMPVSIKMWYDKVRYKA